MKNITERFEFRDIRPDEYDQAAEIEQIVFPPHEAVFPDDVRDHAAAAPECFMTAIDRDTGLVAGFLYGLPTDEARFRDDFFTDVSLYDPSGANIMLLGLDVLPEYQGHGLGREIMRQYCLREKARGRKKLILTCLENLTGMYEKFGYTDLGLSGSEWGGETWHEMEIELQKLPDMK